MSIHLYIYTGSFAAPDSEVIVNEVPRRLAKLLPEVGPHGRTLRWAYLHRIWVRAKLRRNGLGRSLMRQTLDTTDLIGFSLVLRVAPFDDCRGVKYRLVKFYKQHGFVSLGAGQQDILIRRI